MAGKGKAAFAEPLEPAAAVRVLVEGAGLDADDDATRAIAELVGRERPALELAATLARTRGWRPVREKLATWSSFATLVRGGSLPWQREVDAALAVAAASGAGAGAGAGAGGGTAAIVTTLAACDAPMTWELIEQRLGADALTVETVCDLEDAGLLVRRARAGVVSFAVPFCVRAALRLRAPEELEHEARGWLAAWLARATELRASLYGSSARATLVELACAIPGVERALLSLPASAGDDASAASDAARAWAAVADAMFFEGSVDYASPAFARAVSVADAQGDDAVKIRVRLAAARALLERGAPDDAEVLLTGARSLAASRIDALASETLRGSGWAALASARLVEAKSWFEEAHAIGERIGDARSRADATAGLGMVALLGGDAVSAREKLTDALAMHVVARDAPREAAMKGMMMLLPEARATEADANALAREVESLRGAGQRWREALALGRLALLARERGDEVSANARLAEARAAASLSAMSASALALAMVGAPKVSSSSTTTGAAAANTITVGPEGRWLLLADGTRHDLARHGPVRRVLHALALARSERPGAAMSTLDVVEAGWPGEKMRHEAATLRVYTTVRRLRALGLGDVLVTRDDGYLLDPETPLALSSA